MDGDVDLSNCKCSKPSLKSLIIIFSVQDEPDSSEIAKMKEEILHKFDDNFDGKINLEEVCLLNGDLNTKIVPPSRSLKNPC